MNEWTDTDDWLGRVEAHRGPGEAAIARRIVAWSTERQLKHRGQGNEAHNKAITYMPIIPAIDWDPVPFTVTSKTGRVGLEGSSIGGRGRRPYGSESSFERLLERLKAVPGVASTRTPIPISASTFWSTRRRSPPSSA